MKRLKCDECNRYVGYTEGKDTSNFKSCPQRKDQRKNCQFREEYLKYG